MLFVMYMLLTGTGTSHGIPVIGCSCPVCTSADTRDTRLRSSAIIYGDDDTTIIIDAGPEFRIQALRANLKRLDGVLLTHSHADHLHGLDDIRIFSRGNAIPVYSDVATLADVRERFAYIFKYTQEGGGKPHIELRETQGGDSPGAFRIGSIEIQPIPLKHGSVQATGWRIGDTAYLTDLNYLSDASIKLLKGVTNLVIDGLRYRPHATHFSFTEAMETAAKTEAEYIWITHICHDASYKELAVFLAAGAQQYPGLKGKKIEPAYDGLEIEIKQIAPLEQQP